VLLNHSGQQPLTKDTQNTMTASQKMDDQAKPRMARKLETWAAQISRDELSFDFTTFALFFQRCGSFSISHSFASIKPVFYLILDALFLVNGATKLMETPWLFGPSDCGQWQIAYVYLGHLISGGTLRTTHGENSEGYNQRLLSHF